MVTAPELIVNGVPVVVSFTSVVFPGWLPELYPEAEVRSVFDRKREKRRYARKKSRKGCGGENAEK